MDTRDPGQSPRPRGRGALRPLPRTHVREDRHRHDQRRPRKAHTRRTGRGRRIRTGTCRDVPRMRRGLRPHAPLRGDRRGGRQLGRIRELPDRNEDRTGDCRQREGPLGEARPRERGGHQVRAQPRDREDRAPHDQPQGGVQEPPGRGPRGHPLRGRQARHRPSVHRRTLQQVQPRDPPDHLALQGVPRKRLPPLPRKGQDVRDLRPGDHRGHRPGDGRREGALLPRHGQRGHRRVHARRRKAVRPRDKRAQEALHRPGRAREEVQRRRNGRVQLAPFRAEGGRRTLQGRSCEEDLSRAR